jgi:ribose transport system substrate-binding protein
MTRSTNITRLRAAACLALSALVLTACGGTGTTTDAGAAPHAGGSYAALSRDAAAARTTTQTYTEQPSTFPVDAKLPKPAPTGLVFGWLQCSSSVCAQLTTFFQAAADALHGKLLVVKSGPSSQELQTAMSSLVEQHPSAILLPSVQPQTLGTQIANAKKAGIPMLSTGIMDPEKAGLDGGTFGEPTAVLAGQLLADYVVAKHGDAANVVFYTTPELDFLTPLEAAFRNELKVVCPGCKERTVNVPIATYGTTAPGLIVSDLQAHPDTGVAVIGAAAAASGLVSALNVAGIHTPFTGFSLTPTNLQDITTGSMESGLGLDYPVIAWTMIDEALRLLQHAPLTAAETTGTTVVQWLTADNLHGDFSAGWTGYPDYQQKFKTLWQVG